ncbi:hypothetical protein FSHL1_002460 [Fusarium sambucinum]
MYSLLPSQHLPTWDHYHLLVEGLSLPDVIYDGNLGISSQRISNIILLIATQNQFRTDWKHSGGKQHICLLFLGEKLRIKHTT